MRIAGIRSDFAQESSSRCTLPSDSRALRILLKTTVTTKHVAKAVLFFASRQTPTAGATLPVEGGLPDATPR